MENKPLAKELQINKFSRELEKTLEYNQLNRELRGLVDAEVLTLDDARRLSDVPYKATLIPNLIMLREQFLSGDIGQEKYNQLKDEIVSEMLDTKVRISKKGNAVFEMTDKNKAVRAEGYDEIEKLSRKEYEQLASKSGTLHYNKLLGLESMFATRTKHKGKSRKYVNDVKPIAVELVSDEQILIPRIDVKLNNVTGIEKSDIKYESVEAGQPFILTLYEFMYLIIRDEYAGYCEANGDPRGAYLSVKSTNVIEVKNDRYVGRVTNSEGKEMIPTPYISFKRRYGAIKANIDIIDEETFEGKYKVKPGYERFWDLIPKDKQDNNFRNQYIEFNTDSEKILVFQHYLGINSEMGQFVSKLRDGKYKTTNYQLLRAMRSEFKSRFDKLGCSSGKLFVINELKYPTYEGYRLEGEFYPILVGFTLVSDEDLSVPVIDNKEWELNKLKDRVFYPDVKYRHVKAHEKFNLTLVEFMFLLMRDEYLGVCSIYNHASQIRLDLDSVKGYPTKSTKLPNPEFTRVKDSVSPQEIFKWDNGKAKVFPKFREKFGYLEHFQKSN
ncbi:hypothetical protein [Cohnella massiliensis]|uniref:hypothetical protein n=1 Tax=Cohnella massiliensis TaxID=1816691 RepID=UPI0009B97DA9|nr:hypothetical protein [Cohnella massiliensis]